MKNIKYYFILHICIFYLNAYLLQLFDYFCNTWGSSYENGKHTLYKLLKNVLGL